MHRLAEVWRPGGDGPPGSKTINESGGKTGGEAGIRTLGTTFRSYNGLANRRLQPLGHLTDPVSIRPTMSCGKEIVPAIVAEICNCPCHARKPRELPSRTRALISTASCDRWGAGDAPRLQRVGTASVATSKIEPAAERRADDAAPQRRQIERSGFSARHRSEEPLPLGVAAFGATARDRELRRGNPR
jgi:hypothetical protein